MERALHPERRPVMAGDADAIDRLAAKVAEAEGLQNIMRAVNGAIRRNVKAGKEAQIAAILAVSPAFGAAQSALLLQPDALGRVGYADYELSNNTANIRRIKLLSRNKASPPLTQRGGNGVLCEDCLADNRLRLFFPGKPDEATRTQLKRRGFRWTPSLRCWQAYCNSRAFDLAKQFIRPEEILSKGSGSCREAAFINSTLTGLRAILERSQE